MLVKIFWQYGCPKCPKARALGKQLEEKGHKVEYINIREKPDEIAKYGLMASPSIVIDENGTVKKTWTADSPSLEEIEKFL